MAEHRLVARVAFTNNDFSATFLGWFLALGVLVLFYLFFFNRIIAAIISLVARTIAWQFFRVHVDIQSLQFSPLAGRIFFKRVRYFGQNETIIIQDGYITWQYWLARVQELDADQSQESGTYAPRYSSSENQSSTSVPAEEGGLGGKSSKQDLPCRILIKSRGVQWFIYNRTPVYDDILAGMVGAAGKSTGVSPQSKDKVQSSSEGTESDLGLRLRRKEMSDLEDQVGGAAGNDDDISIASTASSTEASRGPGLPALLNVLPVGVECGKAAVVLGNSWTKSILVARVDRASGRFTAAPCKPADLYRQVIKFDFDHPTVQFKHNKDYQSNLFTEGELSCDGADPPSRRRS